MFFDQREGDGVSRAEYVSSGGRSEEREARMKKGRGTRAGRRYVRTEGDAGGLLGVKAGEGKQASKD